MSRLLQLLTTFGLAFATLFVVSAQADESAMRRHYKRVVHHRCVGCVRDHHVIEKVYPPGLFMINAALFAPDPACSARWVAGDTIRFRSGEKHGLCVAAVLYNASKRQSCTARCAHESYNEPGG
ncbi:MAG TPA: hypothetical protein VHN11_02065 [Xanthobacteraceae bacterium]|jgi:hypothetical protein|nr:hypothetical protein [Xanthobacteraceae bacterium]